MAQFKGSQTFTVPVTAGQYAPEFLTFAKANTSVGPVSLISTTALVSSAAVATAVVELWLLKDGGNPATSTDWFNTGKSITASGSDTWPLAGWDGVQYRVKSGGTAGNLTVSGSAD